MDWWFWGILSAFGLWFLANVLTRIVARAWFSEKLRMMEKQFKGEE